MAKRMKIDPHCQRDGIVTHWKYFSTM